MYHRRLIVLLLLVVLGALPTASRGAPAHLPQRQEEPEGVDAGFTRFPTPDGFFGIVVRDPYYEWNINTKQIRANFVDAQIANLKAAGVEWVRFEFQANWGATPYGTFDLQQADYFVDQARANGIKVLALLNHDILRGSEASVYDFKHDPDNKCAPAPIGCGVNDYMTQFISRTMEIADYYEGRIDAYEIFNEENRNAPLIGETESRGLPYEDEIPPHLIARLMTKIFRILRSRGDTTQIILGGLQPAGSVEMQRTDVAYLEAIYTSESFQSYFAQNGRWPVDGIGYHPYPREIRPTIESDNDFLYRVPGRLEELLAKLRAYDQSAKLWFTEVGTRGDYRSDAAMSRQRRFLKIFYQIAYNFRKDIETVMWFKQEDWVIFPPPGVEEEWGLVHIPYVYEQTPGFYDPWRYDPSPVEPAKWQIKPAYRAYQDLALNGIPRTQVYVPALLN